MIPSPTNATANHSHSPAAAGVATLYHNHHQNPSQSLAHAPTTTAPGAPTRIFKRGDRIPYAGEHGGAGQFQPPPIRQPQPVNHPHAPVQPPPVTAAPNPNLYPASAPASTSTLLHRVPNPKTATTLVIELAKYHRLSPEFKLIQTEGPSHCPTFTVQCTVGNGPDNSGTGTGLSIKKATLAAAEAFLHTTDLPLPPPKTAVGRTPTGAGTGSGRKPKTGLRKEQTRIHQAATSTHTAATVSVSAPTTADVPSEKNPISLLNEYCNKNLKKLVYTVVEERGPPHSKVFRILCVVDDVLSADGEGCTKQLAKTEASKAMVEKIPELITTAAGTQGPGQGTQTLYGHGRGKPFKKPKPKLRIIKEDAVVTGSDSPINKLAEFATHNGLGEPKYECWEEEPLSASLPQHGRGPGLNKKKVFVVQARVGAAGGYVSVGKSTRKQDAKHSAAVSLLHVLQQQQQGQGQGQTVGTVDARPNAAAQAQAPVTQPPQVSMVPSPPVSVPAPPPITVTGHQLKPGLIVLNKPNDTEHTDKLSYLADLIGFHLSFADFPKKDEYLSVLSLSTDPPHVAHGVGKTLVEARNQASQKILDELKETGLESGPTSK